jgi:hypothetical protein
LNPKNQPIVDLPTWAKPLNVLLRFIRLLWQTRSTVESIKLIPVHSPLQQ